MRGRAVHGPGRVVAALLLAVSLLLGAFAPAAAALQPVGTTNPVAGLSVDQHVATLQQAFDLLMDRFVHPLKSSDLLAGAWAGLDRDARAAGAPAPGIAPTFTGVRTGDFALFTAAFTGYESANALPSDFSATYAAIRGMANVVNEAHTHFMTPREYEEHLAWSRGDVRYGGIGARMRGPELTVTEVFPDSPAERAGLQPGDVIVEVDGRAVAGMSVDETVGLIRGPAGTAVTLLVRRSEVADPLRLRVLRDDITLDFVVDRMLDPEVGYVLLRGFPEPSVVDRVVAAVQQFQAEGAQALVLDLRGNSGGRLDVGARLLSRFLPAGSSLYEQIDRNGREETRASRSSSVFNLPMVVLVDGGTASMGEIFAAALQEHGAATLLGEQTSGNVAAGQVFPLNDGSALQVTVMEILSGEGRRLNQVGVTPDEVVDTTAWPEGDIALGRALEVLHAALAPAAARGDTSRLALAF